jgi:hypothetical protein
MQREEYQTLRAVLKWADQATKQWRKEQGLTFDQYRYTADKHPDLRPVAAVHYINAQYTTLRVTMAEVSRALDLLHRLSVVNLDDDKYWYNGGTWEHDFDYHVVPYALACVTAERLEMISGVTADVLLSRTGVGCQKIEISRPEGFSQDAVVARSKAFIWLRRNRTGQPIRATVNICDSTRKRLDVGRDNKWADLHRAAIKLTCHVFERLQHLPLPVGQPQEN